MRAGTWYECTGAPTCGWKVLGRCEVWMTNVALEAGSCAAGACWTRVTLAEMICRRAPHFQQPPVGLQTPRIDADDSCLTSVWLPASSKRNSLRYSVSTHVLATGHAQQSHSSGHQRVEARRELTWGTASQVASSSAVCDDTGSGTGAPANCTSKRLCSLIGMSNGSTSQADTETWRQVCMHAAACCRLCMHAAACCRLRCVTVSHKCCPQDAPFATCDPPPQ